MFRFIVSAVHSIRETLLAVFLATAAFLNLSPDSQAGFLHHWIHSAFEASERWHIVVSVVSMVLFLASLAYAVWKNWDKFALAFRAVWNDHKTRNAEQERD